MSQKANIPHRMLSKAVGVFSVAPLFVLAIFVIMGAMEVEYAFYAAFSIIVSTAVLVKPYLYNIVVLTNYVYDLTKDKRVDAPDLSFLGTENELSDAILHLHRSWEKKKQQLESMLSEREILVDTLPDVLLMIDAEEQILRTNSAARQQFGQNLAHRRLSSVIRDRRLYFATKKTLETGESQDIEFQLDEAVSHYYRARIERFPAHSPGGISAILTLHDITELKTIEQMRADFVANASHEIKTPLASLVGFIETLRGPAKDDPQARDQFLEIMAEQADRMTKLVSDLLSLSRIEMNVHTEPQGLVDVAALMKSEAQHSEWSAKKKNITFQLEMEDGLPQVQADEMELSQVMRNLVENAIKYGKEGGVITLRVWKAGRMPAESGMRQPVETLCFSVTDQGDGIPPEHIPRLTERFYRVDKARSRKVGGTGLGLAIVKHVLNRHKAYLKIDSTVGKGSTFAVYIPVSRPQGYYND